MREQNYDQYQDHKDDHKRVLDEVHGIMDDYEDNACFSDGDFAGHVERWFTEHFRTKGSRLHKHLGR